MIIQLISDAERDALIEFLPTGVRHMFCECSTWRMCFSVRTFMFHVFCVGPCLGGSTALFSDTWVHRLSLPYLPCCNQTVSGEVEFKAFLYAETTFSFSLTPIITRHVVVFGLMLNLATIPENKGSKPTMCPKMIH